MRPYVLAVVGAQYGSEGKGVVVNHIADRFGHHVRVGGPNAGHSFKFRDRLFKMRSLPCGWTNPAAQLYIGPGAVFDPQLLMDEVLDAAFLTPEWGGANGVLKRLTVDPRAWVIKDEDRVFEQTLRMQDTIGSTMEGVGAARLCRVGREVEPRNAGVLFNKDHLLYDCLGDVAELLANAESPILLEGTQGFGLSLTHGHWPYVTSHDTTAAQLATDCGLGYVSDVLLVARTMPIRVAGNSGPLAGETTWEALSLQLGWEVQERTTVTGRIRRIGTWDQELFRRAQMINDASMVALTFCDYLDPAMRGRTALTTPKIEEFIKNTIEVPSIPCTAVMLGTGGDNFSILERDMRDFDVYTPRP